MSTEVSSDNLVLHAAQQAHEEAFDAAEHRNPIIGFQSKPSTPLQTLAIDESKIGEAVKTPQALKTASEPNAASIVPNTHTSVVNPATGLSHNAFTWFYQHVISKAPSVFAFVGKAAIDTEKVVSESASSPVYATAQSNLVASALALATAASIAVAEKGLNPTQDMQTINLLEDLVSKAHSYIGVLEAELKSVNTPKPAVVSAEV